MNRVLTFAATLILIWIIGSLLIVGRGVLIPIIIALFIWNLFNTLNNVIQRVPLIHKHFPNWASMILSIFIVIGLISILIDIISTNVNDVILASNRYQEHLMTIFNNIDKTYRLKVLASLDGFLKSISVQGILVNIYAVFTSLTSSAVLIILYIAFLFVEQLYFSKKMNALFPQVEHRQLVDSILTHVLQDIQTYLGLKTVLSIIAAILSWILMKLVGLDFAEFWALLIFFLNYIPNIGPIIATVFPALLALLQFDSWLPFAVVTSGIVIIEFVVGNILEPRFLSNSLNLSPLVILFALALWGSIWGVLGMFLAVPITMMMLIIFAHFKPTRPIAILLSQNGKIKRAYE